MSHSALLAKCEMISLESESGAAASAFAVKRLPDYFNAVKNFMAKSVTTPFERHFSGSNNRFDWTRGALRHFSYIELQDTLVACPLGFKGDYVNYTKALLEASELASQVFGKCLVPYNAWLEAKLGDPSTFNSLITAKVEGYQKLEVEKQIDHLHKFFVDNGREFGETAYKNLVRRNNDWAEIADRMRKIEAIFTDEQHKYVMDTTSRLTKNLDTLLHRLETESHNYKLSSPAIKTLAERSYECARAVEYYALVRGKVVEMESALKDLSVHLNDKRSFSSESIAFEGMLQDAFNKIKSAFREKKPDLSQQKGIYNRVKAIEDYYSKTYLNGKWMASRSFASGDVHVGALLQYLCKDEKLVDNIAERALQHGESLKNQTLKWGESYSKFAKGCDDIISWILSNQNLPAEKIYQEASRRLNELDDSCDKFVLNTSNLLDLDAHTKYDFHVGKDHFKNQSKAPVETVALTPDQIKPVASAVVDLIGMFWDLHDKVYLLKHSIEDVRNSELYDALFDLDEENGGMLFSALFYDSHTERYSGRLFSAQGSIFDIAHALDRWLFLSVK